MDLRKKAIKGLKWTISSAVVQAVLQLLKLGIITRLLPPEDFGLMAIVLLVLGVGELFKDLGMSAALIHRQDVSSNQLSSLYWLNVVLGLVLFLVIASLSLPISVFFEVPVLLLLIPFSASTLFFQTFGQQYSVLFRKELAFDVLESISLFIKVIDFIVVVTLASLGYGVWALVFAQIISSISSSALFFIFGRKIHIPSFRLKVDDIRPFFSFGLYQMGGQMMNYLNSHLDKIILGKFFGMEVLGFYNLAWQLIQYPKTKINPIINKITFPLFSRLQTNTGQLEKYYSFSLRSLILLIVPMYVFLGVFASDIVTILFGAGWQLSAQLVQILAGLGILKTIANPGGSVLLAMGRADIEFWWNVFWIIVSTAALLIGLQMSPHIFTLAYILLLLNGLGSLLWHYIIYSVGHIKYKKIIGSLLKSFFIACFTLLLVDKVISPLFMFDPVFMKFAFLTVSFMVLYIWLIRIIEMELTEKIACLIKDALTRKKR